MNIIRAEVMGMCFGVRDALQITETIGDASQVTVHGELVHNPEVNSQLATRGFHQLTENDRSQVPKTPKVLITAHGVSDIERRRLEQANKQLIDTTCPLVRHAHDLALELQAESRHVLVIGKQGHVEVQGIVEDLQSYDVIGKTEDVRQYQRQLLGIVCQTTIPPNLAEEICTHIQLHNPLADIRFIDTICQPTKLRQSAMQDLLTQVDAVVVVGGNNSNNTRRLVSLCHEYHTPVLHVERADELYPNWFADVETVGLTAGTSTLNSTIDEVYQALLNIGLCKAKGNKHAKKVDAESNENRTATQ